MADASTHYSFIDIAAWDGVREYFLTGRPIMVFSQDLQSLLWANGPAAELFGFATIGEFETQGAQGMRTALRQLRTAAGRVAVGGEAKTHVRISSGMTSKLLETTLRGVAGRDGARCVVVVIDTGASAVSEDGAASAAIAGLAAEGAGAAIVDAHGALVAADPLFAGISFPADAIGALVREVRDEKDRLVKRLVTPQPATPVAVAIARLTDSPPLHLVMAVKSASAAEAGLDDGNVVATVEAETGAAEPEAVEAEIIATVPTVPEPETAVADEPAAPPVVQDEPVQTPPAPGRDAAEAPEPAPTPEPTPDFVADFDTARGPIRFVWRTDADGLFTDISPEFSAAVGPNAADVIGRSFEEVARVFELDPSGDISASLKRHDTWSGKSVLWPVEGTAWRVPVDLAALPSYNRQRDFEGYRGFGIVRMSERAPDPESIGLTLASPPVPDAPAAPQEEPAPETDKAALPETAEDRASAPAPTARTEQPAADPFDGETPALAQASPSPMRRESDKVIAFTGKHRSRQAGEALNPSEQAAFRQIGDVLGWARVKSEGDEEAAQDRAQPARVQDDVVSELPAAEAEIEEAVSVRDYVADDGRDVVTADVARPEDDDTRPDDITAMLPMEDAAAEAEFAPAESFADDEAETEKTDDGLTPAFLDGLPLPVLIHRDDKALFCNEAFAEMSGYGDADALNEAGGIEMLFDGDPDAEGILSVRRADGDARPARARLQTVQWQGRTALMFAFEPHVTTPVEVDAGDTRTEDGPSEAAELRAILDTASDGVVILSRDGVIRSINASASALFGYSGEDVEGKSFSTLFAHESQAAALDYLAGLANNGVASVLNEGLEVLGREKHGGFLPLFMTIGRLETSDGFCAVVRDITSWKQTEQALRDAQRNAEQASSHKTEFLAKISHEIRTPLNAIIGFSELMAEERFGPIGNERYKDYLTDINKSGKYVLDLVNDLLDISKIEAGKQELEFESVSLNKAVEEAISMVQPQASRSRIIVRSSLDEELPGVVADARSIKQIVLNILSNSVRFTHSGGQVIVNTSYNARGEVVLRIKDTGIGMSAKEIETALQPFQQVASLGRARGDGTGLGLPLTKALVEANRAEFAIQSEPGRGTAVEIVFPPSRVLAS